MTISNLIVTASLSAGILLAAIPAAAGPVEPGHAWEASRSVAASNALEARHHERYDLAPRRRVAGSYLIEAVLTGSDETPFEVQALATLGADGGVVSTDTDDFGLGTGVFFHSTKHGAWRATGDREVSITVLEFAYDAAGALTTIFRLGFDIAFDDRSFSSGEGVLSFDAFLPGQDPLDETQLPVDSGIGKLTFRRISAD